MRLIDADALLEAIHKIYGDNHAPQGIINLITNAPTVQREGWVSVEDRVPDDGIYCIAAIIKNNEIWNWNKARYSSTAKSWFNGNKADQDFTHWQPLPDAPKE